MAKGKITLTSTEPRFLFISPDGIYAIVLNADTLGNNGVPVVPSGDYEGDDCVAVGSIQEELPFGEINLKDYDVSKTVNSLINVIVKKNKDELRHEKVAFAYAAKPNLEEDFEDVALDED